MLMGRYNYSQGFTSEKYDPLEIRKEKFDYFRTPEGKVVMGPIVELEKKHKLPYWVLRNLRNRPETKTAMGWSLANEEEYILGEKGAEDWKRQKEFKKNAIEESKKCKIKEAKSGEILEINDLREFCKQRNLNYDAMYALIHGPSKISQGYVLPETNPKETYGSRIFVFSSPEGEIVKGSRRSISKKYGVSERILSCLYLNQNYKNRSGWSFMGMESIF